MVCSSREARQDAHTEVKLLKAMKHKNIIALLDSRIEGSEFMLLFEFVEKSAYDVISKGIEKSPNYDFAETNTYGAPFSEVEALELILGCCEALHYMHTVMKVCHRDFKPHNVLLRYDGGGYMGGPTALVMDVGSVAPLNVEIKDGNDALNIEEESQKKCSAPYRSPELTTVEIGTTIGAGSDVWSLGCTLFGAAFGFCPFETPKEGVLKLGILNGRFFYPRSPASNQFSEGMRGLINQMLSVEAEKRGTPHSVGSSCQQLLSVYK